MPREFGPATRVLVLKLHPRRAARIGLGGDLHAGVFDQGRRLSRFVVELLALAGLGAIAAAGDDERCRATGVRQAEMQCRETAHRNANDMRLGDREPVEHGADIVAGAVLRIAAGILGHIGGWIAAGIVRDAAIAPRKVADLRFEAAVIVGKLWTKTIGVPDPVSS